MLHKRLGIDAAAREQVYILFHDPMQTRHRKNTQHGELLGGCCPSEEPLDPNGRLCQPLSDKDLLCDNPRVVVNAVHRGTATTEGHAMLQQAIDHKVHFVGNLTLAVDVLLLAEGNFIDSMITNCAHCIRVVLLVVEEERVPCERWHVHLMLQVHLEHLRDVGKERNIAPHHSVRLSLLSLLIIAPNPHCKLHRYIVFSEEPPELCELRFLATSNLAEVCHSLRDAADKC
mmetsp:Transcript_79421/g.199561  ORF Transcript_79421/g.199561 Transcript_79421/m.199561 type:complete len:230 (+) Transcript_79421:804-1493(+)